MPARIKGVEQVDYDATKGVEARKKALIEIRQAFEGHPDIGRIVAKFERAPTEPLLLTGDSLSDYLEITTKRYRIATKDEQYALCKQISAGISIFPNLKAGKSLSPEEQKTLVDCAAAYEVMINTNIRLVVSLAMKYKTRLMHMIPDLVQEGVVGLTTAIANYDFRKGNAFSTYATWWIRQGIIRYIANTARPIRLPVHQHEKWGNILKTEQYLTAEYGRPANDKEIADELGMHKEQVEELRKFGGYSLPSLNATVGDGETEFGQMLPSEASDGNINVLLEELPLQRAMDEIFNSGGLSLRQMQMLSLRFGIFRPELSGSIIAASEASKATPDYDSCFNETFSRGNLTLDEIGKIFGFSRERVRQIENIIFEQIRRFIPELREAVQD